MKKNKVIYTTAMILSILFVLASFIFNVLSIMSNVNVYAIISAVVSVLALFAALYYLSKGHKKEDAIFLKYLTGAMMVSELVNLLYVATTKPYVVAMCGVCLICITILTFGKDLGMKFSFVLCGIILALRLALVIINGIKAPNLFETITQDSVSFLRSFADFSIAFIVTVCIYGKYIDKTERNRKV